MVPSLVAMDVQLFLLNVSAFNFFFEEKELGVVTTFSVKLVPGLQIRVLFFLSLSNLLTGLE